LIQKSNLKIEKINSFFAFLVSRIFCPKVTNKASFTHAFSKENLKSLLPVMEMVTTWSNFKALNIMAIITLS